MDGIDKVIMLFGLCALAGLIYAIVLMVKNTSHSQKDGFTEFGQPNYALAIGLPVGIVAVMVAFKLWATWGKR